MTYLFSIHEEEPAVSVPQIRAVFAYWKQLHPRSFPRVHPGLKEWKQVKNRLADGYTVDDLKAAIDGIHVSPFHLGENERGKNYVSLELCMRDAKHVEQFQQALADSQKPVVSEQSQRTARAGLSWAERKKQQLGQQLAEQQQRLTEGPGNAHG